VLIWSFGSTTGRRGNPPKAFCAQNGAVKEVKLELAFSRYETYEEKIREVYRPKGLLAYATGAREYVKLL
jgi:hypothetical protein